mgnify:CR=1 FL=1
MQKRPFIIDCDTGTDDAIAIIAALYSDEVEVKAVTSVNGNVEHKYVCQNNFVQDSVSVVLHRFILLLFASPTRPDRHKKSR